MRGNHCNEDSGAARLQTPPHNHGSLNGETEELVRLESCCQLSAFRKVRTVKLIKIYNRLCNGIANAMVLLGYGDFISVQ